MSWFSFRKEKEPASGSSATQTLGEPEVHKSLALPSLLERMSRGKTNVLDLGAAVGSNVEFLSQYGCKLSIEDLFQSKTTAEGEVGAEFFEQFLPLPEGAQYDVILAWDLFNYFTRKELSHLTARLRQACRPGGHVLALVWIHKTIPAQPIRFRFHGKDQLAYERRSTLERPGSRFQPADINQLMSGFRVDRSFLLRHGIQEYLFVRE
ncbi:MAG TPA: class I SAM-dependent methyltransferase [Thermoanaerobaculia bacterium]|nr:class I SAM-dependent methyltransferase [Thermoanaerobaculia bacterium]